MLFCSRLDGILITFRVPPRVSVLGSLAAETNTSIGSRRHHQRIADPHLEIACPVQASTSDSVVEEQSELKQLGEHRHKAKYKYQFNHQYL